jgi:hypothetical protein
VDNLNQVRATVELERNKLAFGAWESDLPTAKSLLEFDQACHHDRIASLSMTSKTALFSLVARLLPLAIQPLLLVKRAILDIPWALTKRTYRKTHHCY